MFSRCSIWNKLLLGVAMLALMVALLSASSILGVSSYRRLVRSVSQRATELPLADKLVRSVSEMRITFARTRQWRDQGSSSGYKPLTIREDFRIRILEVNEALKQYDLQLANSEPDVSAIGDNRDERETVQEVHRTLKRIDQVNREEDWVLDRVEMDLLGNELDKLDELASSLPSHLQRRMQDLKGNVRGEYHTRLAVAWTTSILATLMLAFLVKFFDDSIFRPLRTLIRGSRQVAAGDFAHRIQLSSHDEMADLAGAMNEMTARFQEIRDDLDRQVKQRTKEVVRSEQLASVGFLAAGVSHEINNPLASIAWCAEALEARLHDILYASPGTATDNAQELDVLRRYLRRIQDEAFRCKGITEKLLDFSRMGEVERQEVDLGQLTRDVIDMVRHLGRYRNKRIEFLPQEVVKARINPQEIKQVVLNLLTNALDSIEPPGIVEVELRRVGECALLRVTDNGCGMTDEVQEHLFEPFFTRRRDGQGTGLGLSIAFRIAADHGGSIQAHSDGPGKGSTFRVTLPLVQQEKAHERRPQAA